MSVPGRFEVDSASGGETLKGLLDNVTGAVTSAMSNVFGNVEGGLQHAVDLLRSPKELFVSTTNIHCLSSYLMAN